MRTGVSDEGAQIAVPQPPIPVHVHVGQRRLFGGATPSHAIGQFVRRIPLLVRRAIGPKVGIDPGVELEARGARKQRGVDLEQGAAADRSRRRFGPSARQL